MMRNAVKEKCGYMMFFFLLGFMLIQSYIGDFGEPRFAEDIIVGLTHSEREKINEILKADTSENEIPVEVRPPDENEYIKDLDEKIEEEIDLSEFLVKDVASTTPNVAESYVDSLELIHKAIFVEPQDVAHSDNFIDIGMILINLQKTQNFESQFQWKITRTFDSMMTYSSGTPLHFVVITDEDSKVAVAKYLSHFISKRISEGAILQPSWRKKKIKGLPVLKISLVELKAIKKIDEPFIQALKMNTQEKDVETIDKYSSDLFYIGPLYHRAFEKLDRLIFIDTTDIHFYEDVKVLQDQFENIKDEIMGVGLDLSPHYRKFLVDYLLINPDSPLGLPGKQQGFNTGVVLYRFDNMRKSKLYNSFLTPERVNELSKLYMYNMTLGDQDWFTNLGFSHPELFYILPCQFNTQTSIQYLQPPWESMFDRYHYCDEKKNMKIIHRNGCGPMPEQCGYTPEPDSEYWAGGKSHMTDMYMDIEALWEIMRDVHLGLVEFQLFQAEGS